MFAKLFKLINLKFGFDAESEEKTEIYEGEAYYYQFLNDIRKKQLENSLERNFLYKRW